MSDLIFLGVALGFFISSAWLVAFADRIMPTSTGHERPDDEKTPRR